MKELVLELVACCENRVLMVEELIASACDATVPLDDSLGEVAEERSRLSSSLQDILARNCSFRKKDFVTLMEKIVSEAEAADRQIKEERRLIRAELEGYLSEQKRLTTSLGQQLLESADGGADKASLELTVERLKASYQQRGQAVHALLRDFQSKLDSLQSEQRGINHQLRRLVDKGDLLRIEDLRQLEAARAGQGRKTERQLRQQKVGRLLAQFRQRQHSDGRRGDSSTRGKSARMASCTFR